MGRFIFDLSAILVIAAVLFYLTPILKSGKLKSLRDFFLALFFFSSYIVVYKYPTPIGTSEKLIRD